MGLATTLSGITISANAQLTGANAEMDMVGQLSVCRTKAADVIAALNELKNALPGGDANLATINTLITNLS